MPLETILRALEDESAQKMAQIEAQATAEVDQILADAQAQAEAVRQKHLDAIQAPLKADQARTLNKANLQALQIVLGAREALISAVLEATAEYLAASLDRERYANVLQALAQEAIAALAIDGPVILLVQDSDVPLMERIVKEMGLSARVESDLAGEGTIWGGLGGLIAAAPDGRIHVINTLEARLQQVAVVHRAEIVDALFGETQEA